jgi:hypothetical protein
MIDGSTISGQLTGFNNYDLMTVLSEKNKKSSAVADFTVRPNQI